MVKEPTELPRVFIRERMKKPRVTAKELAEKMETSEAQVSRLLSGKRKMSLEWLYAFSQALDVPIAALFHAPDDPDLKIPKDQIWPTLLRMDGATERSAELAYLALTGTVAPTAPIQTQLDAGDQSEPSTPRREPAPSRPR
jgi:transcriptional regulator with XRE-family HTH domain